MRESLAQNSTTSCGIACNALVMLADKLEASSIRLTILDAFPDTIVTTAYSGPEAVAEIRRTQQEFAIVGLTAADQSWLSALPQILAVLKNTPVLAIAGRHAPRTLRAVNKIPQLSVFDPVTEDAIDLRNAMRAVAKGHRYLSKSMQDLLFDERELKPELLLSATEEKVLSIIGDGSPDMEASPRLALAVATVATHRRNIMRKLGIHHKGELIRFALKHEYVTLMLDGALLPGLVALLSKVEIQ